MWVKKEREGGNRGREVPIRSPPKLKRVNSPHEGGLPRPRVHHTSDSMGDVKSVSPMHIHRGSMSILSSVAGETPPADFNTGVGYSFAKEPRLPDRSSKSPGPGHYSPSLSTVKSRSPGSSFSKRPRQTEILNSEWSPGPIYNPSLNFASRG